MNEIIIQPNGSRTICGEEAHKMANSKEWSNIAAQIKHALFFVFEGQIIKTVQSTIRGAHSYMNPERVLVYYHATDGINMRNEEEASLEPQIASGEARRILATPRTQAMHDTFSIAFPPVLAYEAMLDFARNLELELDRSGASSSINGLDEQQNALAEARLRITARIEQVEKWTRKDATDMINANWDGIIEGLRQARQIIGNMWDELPAPKPQAVIDHEAHMRQLIEETNTDYTEQYSE